MFPLRYLLTRRWMLSIVLALVFAVVAVMLGNWQFGKHQDKVERRDTVSANYTMPPVSLTTILDDADQPLSPTAEWTRVEVAGVYQDSDLLLVRNRPYRGVFGYEVLVPFEPRAAPGEAAGTSDAGQRPLLLVDRGWVPNAETAATLPEVPATPAGEVTVTGWLRAGEEDLGRDLPSGQIASINVSAAEQALGAPLYQGYLLLQEESPEAAEQRPAAADPPDTGIGVHLAYALQWWLTAPVGLILIWVMARREWREGHRPHSGHAGPAGDDDRDSAGDADSPAVLAAAGAPAKPRKRRIWDEEDG
ncbi:MAG: SURF1 family protein [Ornithinimicrobium sp.]